MCSMLGRQPSSTRTDSCNSRFRTKRCVLGGWRPSGHIRTDSETLFPGIIASRPPLQEGLPPKTAFFGQKSQNPLSDPTYPKVPDSKIRPGRSQKLGQGCRRARTAINPASNTATALRAQKSSAPDKSRVNPPRKVGARSQLSGFRINGHESPFHRLS